MKKLSIKNLVDFRGKSDRSKKNFVENIKFPKIEVPSEGGGDYWITSVSAVNNSYRSNDIEIVNEKIEELREKTRNTNQNIAKNMYQRNVAILQKYKSLDIKKLRPPEKVEFLKKSTANSVLTIKGLQIQTKPNHVFMYNKDGDENIGAIWFIAKLKGYRIEEVGLATELLYRYIKSNYSKKYQLNSKYCLALDVVNGNAVNYFQIENGDIPAILIPTIDDINRLM